MASLRLRGEDEASACLRRCAGGEVVTGLAGEYLGV
jgi:hypothetical protein